MCPLTMFESLVGSTVNYLVGAGYFGKEKKSHDNTHKIWNRSQQTCILYARNNMYSKRKIAQWISFTRRRRWSRVIGHPSGQV